MSLRSEYDRQLLFEHITNRVHRERWVEIHVGGERWRAMLVAPDAHTPCTTCGEALIIAHASAGSQLCTRCRMRSLH